MRRHDASRRRRHDLRMPLFRRNRAPQAPSPEAIADFWRWWTKEGDRHCAHLVEGGNHPALDSVLGPAVDRVHPGLAWEVGSDPEGGHVLVVSAAGDPTLRATARRWLLAAPAPNGAWEYADTRQPIPAAETGRLQIAGVEVSFADVRTAWRVDADRLRVDVAVHHPAFGSFDEDLRLQVAFLALDNLLGEEAVELWVGEITTVVGEPSGATTLTPLGAAVQDLAREHSGPEPTWQLLEATTSSGAPLIAMVRLPLTSVTAPNLDAHVRVELPYPAEESGLPGEAALRGLRDLEDRITERLDADGRVVAHETTGGRRTVHVYVDSTTDAADRVGAVVADYPRGRTTVTLDPAWEAIAHLRG
jgi:hypothetical protein